MTGFRHEAGSRISVKLNGFQKAELYWDIVIKLKNFPADLLFRICRQILDNLKLFVQFVMFAQPVSQPVVADPHLNALEEIF